MSTQGHGGEEESVLFVIRVKDALLKEGSCDQVTTTVFVPSQVVKISYRHLEVVIESEFIEMLNLMLLDKLMI